MASLLFVTLIHGRLEALSHHLPLSEEKAAGTMFMHLRFQCTFTKEAVQY